MIGVLTPSRMIAGGVALLVLLALGYLILTNARLAADARAAEAMMQLEVDRREADRLTYERAQREAAEAESARLAAMIATQEQTHDESLSRFGARLADLDRQLGGVRVEVVTPAGGPAADLPAAALPDAAQGAAAPAYPPCDRACLASLIQLDELITFVETTAAQWPTTGDLPDGDDPQP